MSPLVKLAIRSIQLFSVLFFICAGAIAQDDCSEGSITLYKYDKKIQGSVKNYDSMMKYDFIDQAIRDAGIKGATLLVGAGNYPKIKFLKNANIILKPCVGNSKPVFAGIVIAISLYIYD